MKAKQIEGGCSMMDTRRTGGMLIAAILLLIGVTLDTAQAGPVVDINDDAFLQIDFQTQVNAVWRDTGSGAEETSDTTDFFIRRARLGVYGQMNDTWGFLFSVEQIGDQLIRDIDVSEEPSQRFFVYESYVFADLAKPLQLRIGLTKTPFTRETLEDCFDPLTLDRSYFVFTPFQRMRDTGLAVWGNLADGLFQYRVAAMEGRENAEAPESSPRYTVRAHISPLDPENAYGYKGTYLGQHRSVLTIGGGYQCEPNAAYGNVAANTLSSDYQAWTVDGFLEVPSSLGTITLSGAYLDVDFDDAYKGGDPDENVIGIDGQKHGYYAKAGYLLPGKIGPGEVQVFSRYEEWRFARLSNIYDQQIRWWGAGLNYFIKGQDLRVTVQYDRTDFDIDSSTDPASTEDFNTVTTMLQFRL